MKKGIALLLGLVLCLSLMPGYVWASASGHPISGANVQLLDAVEYSGQAHTPKIDAEFCGISLVEGVDYTLGYANNIAPGIATVTMTGKGNFSGTKEVHFLIQRADISSAEITNIVPVPASGERITQDITVTLGGNALQEGVDWAAHYYQNVRPGIAKLLIMGIGNYTGVIEQTFPVNYVGQPVTQSVNQSTGSKNIDLEVGQTLELSVQSLGSDWSFEKYTVSDGRKSTSSSYSVSFTKSGSYTITGSFSYYWVGYEYVNGVLRKVVKTNSATCTLHISVKDLGSDVEAVEFQDYKEDGAKAINLLLRVAGDNAADPELYWSSSDTSVATVDSFGRITVKKAGETTVTAKTADGTNLKIELALDALNIASKGKVLGLYKDSSGDYSIHVAYGCETLKESVDYTIASMTEANGVVTVVLNGIGVFGGTMTSVLPVPDFDSVQYNIRTVQTVGGIVTVSSARAAYGQTVTVTAQPDSGYRLYGIYLDGEALDGESFIVYGDHSVKAEFVPVLQGEAWDGVSKSAFTSGSGSESDPYQIFTAANLAYMAERVNAGDAAYVTAHYILMNDIDLGNCQWIPIGKGPSEQWDYYTASGTSAFKGGFDGNGKTIHGLNMTGRIQNCYAGLFGSVYSAKIKDLTIKNAVLEARCPGSANFHGILAGGAHNSTMSNCVIDGGQIKGCDSMSEVGGLIGLVSASDDSSGTISGCASSAKISGTAWIAGGLIGVLNSSTVTGCMSAGEQVAVDGGSVGGVVGRVQKGSVQYCQSGTGKVEGDYSTGGFAGTIEGGTIKDSYCTGAVTSTSSAGGFVGGLGGGSCSNCWSGSSVYGTTASAKVGGFAGICAVANAVSNSYFVGAAESEGSLGAMCGEYSGTTTSGLGSGYRAKLDGGTTVLTKLCGNLSALAPTGISEAEQAQASFYTNTMSFNLNKIWGLDGNMLYLKTQELAVQDVTVQKGEPVVLYLNQPVQTDGLVLRVTYGNGLVTYIDSGYVVSGNTSAPGSTQLTISLGGVSTTCSAIVMGKNFAHIDSITEDLARVTVNAEENCLLMIAIYEADGKLFDCVSKNVPAGTAQINVFMSLEYLPTGYKAKPFLLQSDSYVPLV